MAVNKIEIKQDSQTITPIDLTQDTVTVNDVMQGKTFHLPSGEQATGQSQAVIPSGTLNITDNGTYNVKNYESAEVNVSSGSTIYQLQNGEYKNDSDASYYIDTINQTANYGGKSGDIPYTRTDNTLIVRNSGTIEDVIFVTSDTTISSIGYGNFTYVGV